MTNFTLITGSSSGIGEVLAIQLAKNKRNLLLVARRKELLETLAQTLRQQHQIKVEVLAQDLVDTDAFDKILFLIKSKNIVVDQVYNNAGLGFYHHLIDTSWEQVQKTIDLNITALTKISWNFIKYWKENSIRGQLINIASTAAYVPLEYFVVYSASKAYVKSFSLSLRYEVASLGIKVNCVCPGGTKTDFFKTSGQNINEVGQKFMMSSLDCVNIILKGVKHNCPIIIPGFSNKISVWLSKIFPEYLFTYISSKFFGTLMK